MTHTERTRMERIDRLALNLIPVLILALALAAAALATIGATS